MTNTWQDIKNANVILVMGGNAAEAHPCGFKWVTEAKQHNHAKLVVVDPRFTRTASVADLYAPIRPGTDIAFLNRRDALSAGEGCDPARVRAGLHQCVADREGRLRLPGRAVHRLRPEKNATTTARAGTTSSARTASSSPIPRWQTRAASQPAEAARRALHAGDGGADLRHAEDKFLAVCELIASTAPRRQGADLDVRAWLDAAFGRQPEHPRDGDGAVAAGQYRRGGRRDERACADIPTSRALPTWGCCPT